MCQRERTSEMKIARHWAPLSGDNDWPAVGGLISRKAKRTSWQKLVNELCKASSPGGPLEGWVFHGADADAAEAIMAGGFIPSEGLAHYPSGRAKRIQGVHFGTAGVAAFFAEDCILSYDFQVAPAIIGVPLTDLRQCGKFMADANMVECPLICRLGADNEEMVRELWVASSQDWQASYDILGTIIVQGEVPPDNLVIFRGVDDVRAAIRR